MPYRVMENHSVRHLCLTGSERKSKQLKHHLDGKQRESNENDRTNDFRAVLDGQTGAQIVTEQGEDSGDKSDGDEHLAGNQRGDESADVGGKVDQLDISCGGASVHFGNGAEDDEKKSAGAGTVKAVVSTDNERSEKHDGALQTG